MVQRNNTPKSLTIYNNTIDGQNATYVIYFQFKRYDALFMTMTMNWKKKKNSNRRREIAIQYSTVAIIFLTF